MKTFIRVWAIVVLSLSLTACGTFIQTKTQDGITAHTVSSVSLLAPSIKVVAVEIPGHKKITYAANEESVGNRIAGTILPAASGGIVGGILASKKVKCVSNCGDSVTIANAASLATSRSSSRSRTSP